MKNLNDLIKETLKNFPSKICFKKIRKKFTGELDMDKISAKGHIVHR